MNRSFIQGFHAIRVLEDSVSRRRWIIQRNFAHPDWPARAILMAQQSSCGDRAILPGVQADQRGGTERSSTVIRAGESLLIVEDTPVSRVELTAVAMNSGRLGESLAARLRVGGRIVSTVVVAPGRAILIVPGSEIRR